LGKSFLFGKEPKLLRRTKMGATIAKRSLLIGLIMGVVAVIGSASLPVQKKVRQSSPPYTVMVSLQTNASFVPDGRMTFADLAYTATFKDVVFVFDPTDPLSVCSVEAEEGKLILTRHEFNAV
jgi:hypothetical protein